MSDATIELSPAEMKALGYRVVDMLIDHFTTLGEKRIGARAKPGEMRPLLDEAPPEEPGDVMKLVDFVEREILPNTLRVDHPRFFAFVPGPNNFVSAMADAIAAGFNVFNGTWLGGSGAAAMELTVIGWLRSLCGLPDGAGGVLVSGGSVANLTALAAARHARLDDDVCGAVAYLSDQTHSSLLRALRVIGLREEQIRSIETGPDFRLPVDELRRAIRRDREAGLRPFCVVANAGTTNTGAVDPLEELADLCGEEQMWLHADGAYGATAVICEEGRGELAGLERVDSLSLDPHKWLFQSIECGCVLVRDAALLRNFYQVMPEYLRDVHKDEEEVHPCDYGIQLTRSFRALKIWMSLKTFGMAAFREAVARGFRLAAIAERELRDLPGCAVVSPARMAVVCFRFPEARRSPGAIVDGMLADGYAFLTSTRLKGEECLRLCTINPRTTEEEIRETVRRVGRMAGVLSPDFS